MIGLAKLAAGPGNVGIAERPERDPGPGEALLEVRAAGICGTDLHIEADEFRCSPPVTMGHEVCGTVALVGDGVDPSLVGSRVVSETYFSTCGACEWCRDGRTNLCPERRSIGSFADGAFAPRLIVPARNLHRVPEHLDDHEASMAEPLACVCQCLLDPVTVVPGDTVLVTGPGPIGLLAAQVARALGGAVTVTGLARDHVRLAGAERLGFDVQTAEEFSPPDGGFDVVVECSGTGPGATTCLDASRRGGRFVQVGVFGGDVTVPLVRVFERELVMSSGCASTPRSWRRAMALLEQRRVELAPLLSEVIRLADWEPAFAALRAGRALKIVFDPRLG